MRKLAILIFGFLLLNEAYSQSKLPEWKDVNKVIFTAINYNGRTGYINKSTDGGANWTTVWDGEMDALSKANVMNSIAYGNGTLVAVGNSIITSTDQGKTWKEQIFYTVTGDNRFGSTNQLKSVSYGNGLFVAAGSFHVLYSSDGLTWEYVRTGELSPAEQRSAENPSGFSLEDIANDPTKHGKRPSVGLFAPDIFPGLKIANYVLYANNKFFVFGGMRRFEGIMFEKQGDKLVKVKDLTFTGNAAIIGSGLRATWDGASTINLLSDSYISAYSLDNGETWGYHKMPANKQVKAICYHNGLWVAASPFNDIFYTNDVLAEWTLGTRDGERGAVNDMFYANGRFILVANDNLIFGSADGKTWENIKAKKDYGHHVRGVVYVEF